MLRATKAQELYDKTSKFYNPRYRKIQFDKYNIALNERTSLNKLYSIIESLLIKKGLRDSKQSPIYRDFREGDVRHSQAYISKAKKLLG